MEPQEFLEGKLKNCTYYELNEDDKKKIRQQGLPEFIFGKLTSKKFRKWSISQTEIELTKQAIAINIRHQKPIQIVFQFGGYKLWRLPSSPEADWSEFFNIAYICEYLSPILAAYEPGVTLYFSSDDVLVEKMNNIKKADTERYIETSLAVISYFQKYASPNLKIELRRIGDLYGENDFYTELEELTNEYKRNLINLDPIKKEHLYITAELNYKIDGAIDRTSLTAEEIKPIIEQAYIYHEAYRNMSQKNGFVYQDNKVVISAKPTVRGIPLGTTKNSTTKFWVGTGVLERHKDTWAERILSYRQLKRVADLPTKEFPINLIPLKNFQIIRAYEEAFKFSQKTITTS